MAKAKPKAAVKRMPAKAPARTAKAPRKAAAVKTAKTPALKPFKPTAAKASPAAAQANTAAARANTAAAQANKAAAQASKVARPDTKTAAIAAERKTGPLTLPVTKGVEAPVAKPLPVARKTTEAAPTRADMPPAAGFTLLVDGHFKNQFDELEHAKAAATELKGRFPMLRVEIYDAASKTRLPA